MDAVKIYDTMPAGWRLIKALGPKAGGLRWIYNGEPLFSKNYKHALLKQNNN